MVAGRPVRPWVACGVCGCVHCTWGAGACAAPAAGAVRRDHCSCVLPGWCGGRVILLPRPCRTRCPGQLMPAHTHVLGGDRWAGGWFRASSRSQVPWIGAWPAGPWVRSASVTWGGSFCVTLRASHMHVVHAHSPADVWQGCAKQGRWRHCVTAGRDGLVRPYGLPCRACRLGATLCNS